jgi:hypothetical protein
MPRAWPRLNGWRLDRRSRTICSTGTLLARVDEDGWRLEPAGDRCDTGAGEDERSRSNSDDDLAHGQLLTCGEITDILAERGEDAN